MTIADWAADWAADWVMPQPLSGADAAMKAIYPLARMMGLLTIVIGRNISLLG